MNMEIGNKTTIAAGKASDEQKASAIASALKNTSLGSTFDIEADNDKKIVFTAKSAGKNSTVTNCGISVDNGTSTSVAVTRSDIGADTFQTITDGIGAYDGTGDINDKVFSVNGQKFAYVNDANLLGDDNKDINYVVVATKNTVAAADATNMAALIKSKTGISAEANGAKVDLKAGTSSSSTGTGIELQIGANEGQTMSFSLGDMSASALGVDGKNVDLSSQEGAKKATTVIDDAIKTISKARGNMGAVQNRLEHTINNLDTAAENLQTSESRIRDTDMAKEMVEFSKNNILMQAGQSMLAQANQSNQGVLSLLQ